MTLLNHDKAAEILERAGITPTPRRVDIARILFARPQHLSADQVLGQLKTLGQDCSRATVYNTLGLLQRRGLVRAVVVDPSRVFFDSTPAPHQHFYNVDTGELLDIPSERITLAQTPPLPAGTEYAGTDVIVRIRQSR
ncbi:MAG: transcriptional repressor [Xanthomonadaceae bacterium]|nr:transcriptional repressor [Xanthomonadaceae bacterium]